MSIAELLPIVHGLTHSEKLQMMQVLLRDIASEENVEIEISGELQVRPIGLQRNRFSVPQSFFDSLPDDLLDAFEGRI